MKSERVARRHSQKAQTKVFAVICKSPDETSQKYHNRTPPTNLIKNA